MSSTIVTEVLDALDKLAGGLHAGFRPVHAKGTMYSGSFTPSAGRGETDRAPHAAGRPPRSPCGSRSPRGFRSLLTTTRWGPARRGWPSDSTWQTTSTRTSSRNRSTPSRCEPGEEFLEFLRAAAASGPGGPTPPPIVGFLATHPAAKYFVEAAEADPGELCPAAVLRDYCVQVHELGRPEPVRPLPLPPRSRDQVPDFRAGSEQDGRLPRRRTVGAVGQGAGAVSRAGAIGRTGGQRHRLHGPLAGDPARSGVRRPGN